jgi:hypothetical protein
MILLNNAMKFAELVALVEAKGTKPGERYKSSMDAEGPKGIASSPIGKSNYNPEVFVPDRKDPSDRGLGDAVAIIKLLTKAISLLKNDDVFVDQMKGIMNGFKKNRNQISAYQESVLKSKPKTIDNLWGEINRLTKIVNDPKKKTDREQGDWIKDLNAAIALKNQHQSELDAVYDEIDGVTERNEELNNEYLEQLFTVMKHTTKRLYNQLTQQLKEDPKTNKMTTIPINELDWDKLEKEVSKNSEAQMQLLEMLMSEDEFKNPLLRFMTLQENNYDEAKDRYFQLRRGDNYSITTDQLYRNLPLFSFVNYFYQAIIKNPVIKLTTKQVKTATGASSDGGMLDRLGNIKNEREWEEIRPDLISYIKKLKLPKETKNEMVKIANSAFLPVKNRSNSAFKLRSMLKSYQIEESFDDFAARILQSTEFDEIDYKLDLMEVISEKSKTCDGPTKKASSDRKGKKWTKCARQPDGSYKRIHWGQAGVRVTGKSGNTKRKKSFKKRHNCSNAKTGSAQQAACRDWA